MGNVQVFSTPDITTPAKRACTRGAARPPLERSLPMSQLKIPPPLLLFACSFLCTACSDSNGILLQTPTSDPSWTVVSEPFGCADVAPGTSEFSLSPVYSGLVNDYLANDGFHVGYYAYGVDGAPHPALFMNWEALTFPVRAVLVRSGTQTNSYSYDPDSYRDDGLQGPTDPGTGLPYEMDEITFCYEIAVIPTIPESFESLVKTLLWGLDVDNIIPTQTPLLISPGQVFSKTYSVDLGVRQAVERDWTAGGAIHIQNLTTVDAVINEVEQTFGDSPVPVQCDSGLPHTLTPLDETGHGDEMICGYEAELPDGNTRISRTIVTTDVGGATLQGTLDFGGAQVIPEDDCVTLGGFPVGVPATYCVEAVPVSLSLPVQIGPFTEPEGCGYHEVPHSISLVTDDTGATETFDWVTPVVIPCDIGCTLSPGYWKTHSSRGPAPYHDTWAQIGEDSPFFDTGQSWYEVLWNPPQGNAYYILAHAYVAAYLNGLNGADQGVVYSALAEAEALLDEYDGNPQPMSEIRGSVRRAFVSLAEVLDDYNNGVIGPGACSQ